MDNRNLRLLLIYVSIIIALNILLITSQVDFANWGINQSLDYSKDFANALVSDLQDFAVSLGVSERSNVKQALAKLHYDVYLVGSSNELAVIIQNNASDTRALIISEYVKTSGEQVLRVLNNAPEVQNTVSRTLLKIEPLPNGGYVAKDPNVLSTETTDELTKIPTLFNFELFRTHFQSYSSITAMQVEIEDGFAQLINPEIDQDALKFWEREIQTLRADYTKIARAAGFADVSGAGISVTINDKFFSVSARELRRIAGEMYSSGATAIAINGNRLGVNSSIIDSEEGIVVDGFVISTNPVVIEAIGNSQTLSSGIDLLFSVIFKNMFYVDIQNRDRLDLPARAVQ